MRRYWLIFLLSSLCLTMSANVADDAASLFNEHRYQEASALYIKLLQQNPNSALYHYRYARCLYELGDYELAIHHFELSGWSENKLVTVFSGVTLLCCVLAYLGVQGRY